MKHLILFFATLAITNFAVAQNSEINKSYFISAKQGIENMLNGKEQPNYEKAIFLIENAYYENNIDNHSFNFALQNQVNYINELIYTNYDFEASNPKPTLLCSKEQLEQQYKKALANWAIYTYITSNIGFLDSNILSYHKKFNYSFTDPMASKDWTNSLVINLNNTHKGNCFALSSLFKILSNRLNSEAKLCTAPSHIYISHKDNKGISYNVELGSKSFVGTGTLSTLTHSTTESIKNDIALRELNEKQSVALCLVYLAKGFEHKFNNTTDDFILQCAETTIKYDDKNLNALLLKAEYLENKLTAQHKTITQLQTQKEFQEYQTLIANLYNLGYREIPLQMKNQLIKGWSRDTITKLANITYASSEANLSKLLETRQASLSWGLFEENFTDKPTERISNTLFNTKTKKIISFNKEQILYNNYNFDPIVFAWNIDPLAHKYPSLSPYSFVANNPMIFTDQTGAYIVGMDGKPVFMEKVNGKLQMSANASADIKRAGNSMLVTATGRSTMRQMIKAKHEVTMTIDNETEKPDRFAETIHTYDKKTGKLLKADITFYMKTINNFVEKPSEPDDGPQTKKQKDNNFTSEDLLGVNGTHEGTHAANPLALIVHKDAKDGRYGPQDGDRAKDKVEEIPIKVTGKDIDERIIEKRRK
jgi:hypothetical protein